MTTRREVLRDLLDFTQPLEKMRTELGGFSWDSEEELVQLTPEQALAVLGRAESGGTHAHRRGGLG